jgi:DNA-binding XRE family transcriptional regulator
MGGTAKVRIQLARQLGENIAERRRALDWTQDQLAERLGVEAETISRFERGATLPSLPKLEHVDFGSAKRSCSTAYGQLK